MLVRLRYTAYALALARIEILELSHCSLASFEVNYLHFS
jgi:hypothetical protein